MEKVGQIIKHVKNGLRNFVSLLKDASRSDRPDGS